MLLTLKRVNLPPKICFCELTYFRDHFSKACLPIYVQIVWENYNLKLTQIKNIYYTNNVEQSCAHCTPIFVGSQVNSKSVFVEKPSSELDISDIGVPGA